jgi:6-pyruvoyltetrahydropterin/6-carboxytetrahydropterin synthase
MWELSKTFSFEAAHTLGRKIDAEGSMRIHGHSYRAEVTVRGEADPSTGMVVDLGALERAISNARDGLDHHFLDEVEGLGPPTIENLSAWIWRKVAATTSGVERVTVYRDSQGDACTYRAMEENR